MPSPRLFTQDDVTAAFGGGPSGAADILAGLNPRQREAVEAVDGPVRIMAGAGTGKTTVLIKRIAHIIRTGAARPEQILAVTFTKKAAGEMRARLGTLLGDDVARRLTVGNFHAVSAEMLRRHAHLLGLPTRFTVLDDDGQKDVISELALAMGLISSKKDKVRINRLHGQISSWKEDGHDSRQVLEATDLVALSGGAVAEDREFLIQCARLFEGYQAELEARRWCDFADLVLHMVRLFRAYPEVHAEEAGRFTHLMVDEFQDTSPVQNQWVTWMARDHHNICVVGDTDQSIYQWRNAHPEIMLNFPQIWKGARTITIDTNYRSTQEILDIANTVVQPLRDKDGLDKKLTSGQSGTPPKDFLRGYTSSFEEADEIADMIASKLDRGTAPDEIAVLCRSGMIITGIERALRERGIRYVVAGAMKFTDREEIKDAIAWLSLAVNPMDYVAFGRIASKPRRGLGPQKISALRRLIMEQGLSLGAAAEQMATRAKKGSANARTYGELHALTQAIDSIMANGDTSGAILEDILHETGYWDWRDGDEEDPQRDQRMENLQLLISEAGAYERPIDFLEMLSLQSGADTGWGDDTVIISTVHAAKGLEFDVVYCPAMEEGVFPNARSERTSYGADEERRLAHVAWTRARTELHISWAGYRMGNQSTGLPSRYLDEAGLIDTGRGGSFRRSKLRPMAPGQKRRVRPVAL